jgi:hypothetical protein
MDYWLMLINLVIKLVLTMKGKHNQPSFYAFLIQRLLPN